ncbi:TPA: hypothetical protein J2F85_003418 [Escherichia coli]|nr:hypothetical protein [Escherichia coli]
MGMFDFNDGKLNDNDIASIAQRDGYTILRVAISNNGYRQSQKFWGQPNASSIYDGDVLCIVVNRIRKMAAGAKGVIELRSLYNDIRKIKRFNGGNARLIARLREEIIPQL